MRKCTLFCCLVPLAAWGQTLPAGFTDIVVTQAAAPTALAALPDGRLLVASQTGALRIVRDGQPPVIAFTFPASSLCTNSERGLLGVAVDPRFHETGFVYLYYTYRAPDRACTVQAANTAVNRVSRFRMVNDTLDAATETVLLDNISSYNGNHNAGDLHFGKDGYLYVSTGDAGCHPDGGNRCAGRNDAARQTHTLLGKILRIDRDGGIPPSNPWQGSGTVRCQAGNGRPGERCQETFAWGLRNPYRIAFDSNAPGTRFFINDVGQDAWEEINEGAPAADYGWNIREGFCLNGSTTQCAPQNPTPAGLTDPLFQYRHDVPLPGTSMERCNSLAGGAFVPNGFWPAPFDGTYLFLDFVCGGIFQLLRDSTGYRAVDFATLLGRSSVVSAIFAPHQGTVALYYTTYANGGQLRRIRHGAIRAGVVSAASFEAGGQLAPESLVAMFAAEMQSVSSIVIRDASGEERSISPPYRGSTQANFVAPAGLALGVATFTAMAGDRVLGAATALIAPVAPALISADGSGRGPAAAQLVRDGGSTFLILYGSGIRGRTAFGAVRALSAVRALIGGSAIAVEYAGPQPQFAGLDQVNVRLPADLRGEQTVALEVEGRLSNRLTVRFD